MLEINKNSYISIEDANEYIDGTLLYDNPLRVIWSILEDNEKEVYLRRALREIENLMFSGCKSNPGQFLSFPRNGDREVPHDVGIAQIENALGVLNEEQSKTADKQFHILQSLGIVKNTKYSKREQGDIGLSADLTGKQIIKGELSSNVAENILRKYMGSYMT